MRMRSLLAAVLVVAVSVSTAQAEEVCKDAASCKACPIETAMKKLPAITYKVGTQDVCCELSAEKLAKELKEPVIYVVGKEQLKDKSAALTHLVKATEKFVADFATPHKCNVSGTTTIAGQELACSIAARETTKLVKAAMDKIQLTYVVGDEKCQCPLQAASLAKASGKATRYEVAGKTSSCALSSRLSLAQAKYKAAVQALVKANAPKAKAAPAKS